MKYLLPLFIFIYGCSTEDSSKIFSDEDVLKHAKKILSSTPLIDTHNDVPWTIRMGELGYAPRDIFEFDLTKNLVGDTDIPRLREGMVGGQFWSVFIPGEAEEFGYAKMGFIFKEMIGLLPFQRVYKQCLRIHLELLLLLNYFDLQSKIRKCLFSDQKFQ